MTGGRIGDLFLKGKKSVAGILTGFQGFIRDLHSHLLDPPKFIVLLRLLLFFHGDSLYQKFDLSVN